jgi:hypothetical protein
MVEEACTECEDDFYTQLCEIYEEAYGEDTFTEEAFEEIEDDELDAIMKEIRSSRYEEWVEENIIQSVSFYHNVINETVHIFRTSRKKLEAELMKKENIKYLGYLMILQSQVF